jgi:NAD-dependent deacetylase
MPGGVSWSRQAQPNPGHLALVELAGRAPGFTLVTQNVDNLHQRAGSQGVIELHGNIGRIKCAGDGRIITTWQEQQEQDDTPPRCPHCGNTCVPTSSGSVKICPEMPWNRR